MSVYYTVLIVVNIYIYFVLSYYAKNVRQTTSAVRVLEGEGPVCDLPGPTKGV